jgi:hypothetical protein
LVNDQKQKNHFIIERKIKQKAGMTISVHALHEALIPEAAARPLTKEKNLLSAEKKAAQMLQNLQSDSIVKKKVVHRLGKDLFKEEIPIQRNPRSEKERLVHLEKTVIVQIDLIKNRSNAETETKVMRSLHSKEERQDHSVKTAIDLIGLRRNLLSAERERKVMRNLRLKEERPDHSAKTVTDLIALRKNLLSVEIEKKAMKNLHSKKEKQVLSVKTAKGLLALRKNLSSVEIEKKAMKNLHSKKEKQVLSVKMEMKSLFAEAAARVFRSSESLSINFVI